LVRGGHRQGGHGGRCGADRRLLHHQPARAGPRQGRQHGRRADRLADRSRPDDAGAEALELPRAAPAPALRPPAPARDGEGDAPMSPAGAPRVDTIVRGGKVVTASDIVETAVAIKGDKIAAIGPEDLLPPAHRVLDASGPFRLPPPIPSHPPSRPPST